MLSGEMEQQHDWVTTVGHLTKKFNMHHIRKKLSENVRELKKRKKKSRNQLAYENYIFKCYFYVLT